MTTEDNCSTTPEKSRASNFYQKNFPMINPLGEEAKLSTPPEESRLIKWPGIFLLSGDLWPAEIGSLKLSIAVHLQMGMATV